MYVCGSHARHSHCVRTHCRSTGLPALPMLTQATNEVDMMLFCCLHRMYLGPYLNNGRSRTHSQSRFWSAAIQTRFSVVGCMACVCVRFHSN